MNRFLVLCCLITFSVQSNESYIGYINTASKTYGVPAELILEVIKQESAFNPRARSHVGAMGLMQLMPTTAKAMKVSNPYDAKENIMGGTKYLRQMLDLFNGNICFALAAYNWGHNRVQRAIRKHGNNCLAIRRFMPKETREYTKRILAKYQPRYVQVEGENSFVVEVKQKITKFSDFNDNLRGGFSEDI